MKALLVNPWIHDFAAFDLWSKPLGLLTVAAGLRQSGVELRLIDCLDRFHPELEKYLKGKLPRTNVYGSGQYYHKEIEKPAIFKNIPRKFKRYGLPVELFEKILREEPEPDIILVTSGMTYWYPGVFEAIKLLRERFPGAPIVLGGIYARLCARHAEQHSGADQVYGGGDIFEITRVLEQLTSQQLNYSQCERDSYVSPAYDLYETLKYITLRTSNGCPFKCSYCGWYLLKENFKQEPVAKVLAEIEQYWQSGIKNFAFYDEALLYLAENHFQKLLEGVIKRKIRAFFHTPNGLHTRFLNQKLACLMREAGFVQPRLALETASLQRQRETSPKTDNQDFLRAVKYLNNAGYRDKEIAVNILIGLPGQDFAEIQESIDFAGAAGCRIFLEEYSPVPGTLDYERSGLALDDDPLLHNNSAFTLYQPREYEKFQEIKKRVLGLNTIARRL